MKANLLAYLSKSNFLLLLGGGSLLLLHHFVGFFGHYGYDDMLYAQLANDLAHARLDLHGEHFAYRWGLIAPLALLYRCFGISDHVSAIPALLYTFGSFFLMLDLLRKDSLEAKCWATLLFFTSSWTLFYSDKLMTDVPMAFWITLSIWAYLKTDWGDRRRALFFAAGLLGAFCCKETVILTFPCWLILFFYDFYKKNDRKFWLQSVLFAVIFFTIYFLFIYFLTGNIGTRFQTIRLNSYLNDCSYDVLPLKIVLERIGFVLWKILLENGILLSGLLAVTFFSPRHRREWILTVALLMSANFMTISPSSYIPMCTDPRHYLYLVPFLAFVSAKALSQNKFFTTIFYAIFLAIVSSVLLKMGASPLWQIYAAASALMCLKVSKNTVIHRFAWIGILGILCVHFGLLMQKNIKNNPYSENKKNEIAWINSLEKNAIILTDKITVNVATYWYRFEPQGRTFEDYTKFLPEKMDVSRPYYVLHNGNSFSFTGKNWENIQENCRQKLDQQPKLLQAGTLLGVKY